jgi:hypothetical protein
MTLLTIATAKKLSADKLNAIWGKGTKPRQMMLEAYLRITKEEPNLPGVGLLLQSFVMAYHTEALSQYNAVKPELKEASVLVTQLFERLTQKPEKEEELRLRFLLLLLRYATLYDEWTAAGCMRLERKAKGMIEVLDEGLAQIQALKTADCYKRCDWVGLERYVKAPGAMEVWQELRAMDELTPKPLEWMTLVCVLGGRWGPEMLQAYMAASKALSSTE